MKRYYQCSKEPFDWLPFDICPTCRNKIFANHPYFTCLICKYCICLSMYGRHGYMNISNKNGTFYIYRTNKQEFANYPLNKILNIMHKRLLNRK